MAVRTHAEGDGGDDDLDAVLSPLQLDALTLCRSYSSVVMAAPPQGHVREGQG